MKENLKNHLSFGTFNVRTLKEYKDKGQNITNIIEQEIKEEKKEDTQQLTPIIQTEVNKTKTKETGNHKNHSRFTGKNNNYKSTMTGQQSILQYMKKKS